MLSRLDRIAQALERIAPPAPAEPGLDQGMHFRWDGSQVSKVYASNVLAPDRFVGVDPQLRALQRNFTALKAGGEAHDILLWGARGTGKSALVRAIAADIGLAMVEASGDQLSTLPALFERLAASGRPFLVYVDDLSFRPGDPAVRMLRSLLDGGIAARPGNVRLAVTSNHRHLVERDVSHVASESAARHAHAAADDQLALADRFGLVLGFHVPSQDDYLEMVRRHLAAEGLEFKTEEALAFTIERGSRSGRTAWHFRTEVMTRLAEAAQKAAG